MDNIFEIKNINKSFKDFHLKDISLYLPRGYILGLLGPNGAGKSTTIKILLDLMKPDRGEIRIFGMDYTNNETLIKQRIGYVGEEQHFYQDMTIDWTINFMSNFYEKWNHENLMNILNSFSLKTSKEIKDLSKGQKVLLNISLALAHEPDLLILDEPTSGLDPISRREVMDILLDIVQDENKAILFSSHITSDIEQIADYVAFMINGEVALFDNKENILDTWKKISIPDVIDPQIKLTNKTKNIFGTTGITNDIKTLSEYKDIQIQPATLEEILISMVREEKE